jgi:hypothetical protein
MVTEPVGAWRVFSSVFCRLDGPPPGAENTGSLAKRHDAKGDVMKWETPAFVEINMSAEIGGYQTDFDDDREPAGPPLPIEMGTLKGFPNPPSG